MLLAPLAGQRQQFGDGREVPVGVRRCAVSQVGGKQRQLDFDIGPGLVPAQENTAGERVPGVMKPGPMSKSNCRCFPPTWDTAHRRTPTGITPILGLFRCPLLPARKRPGTLADALWQLSPVGIIRCAQETSSSP